MDKYVLSVIVIIGLVAGLAGISIGYAMAGGSGEMVVEERVVTKIERIEVEPDGVLLDYPAQGNQYRITELCGELKDAGYDVSGAYTHLISKDDLSSLIEDLPSLARKPVEAIIGNGIQVKLDVRDLCYIVN